MNQKYAIRKTAELLKDYRLYRAALEYRKDQEENGCFSSLDGVRLENLNRQNRVLSRKVRAIEDGLGLITPLERKVVTHLIIEGRNADDVCELCALERSSVYRYRAAALRKLALIFFAVDEK